MYDELVGQLRQPWRYNGLISDLTNSAADAIETLSKVKREGGKSCFNCKFSEQTFAQPPCDVCDHADCWEPPKGESKAMPEYISREAARPDAFCEGVSCQDCPFCKDPVQGGCRIDDFVKSIPAADVVEVRHGR